MNQAQTTAVKSKINGLEFDASPADRRLLNNQRKSDVFSMQPTKSGAADKSRAAAKKADSTERVRIE